MDTMHNQPRAAQTGNAVMPAILKNKRLGLIKNDTSEWGLKNDKKRVLLYEAMDDGATINRVALLNPSEAILLSLFDGKRTVEEVVRVSADLFGESLKNAEKNIAQLIKKRGDSMEEKGENSQTAQYNPSDFVIPPSEVDLVHSRLYVPIGLTFRVAGECMRDCIYCNIKQVPDTPETVMPLERWDQLAEEVKQLEMISIILSGGDPFMNKNLAQIIEMFTKRSISPFLATKSLVTKEKAKQLKDAGLTAMQVSIDAPSADVADFLTDSPGTFKQSVASIENLLEAGIKVSTNTVITAYNVLLIPELVRLLSRLGVKQMRNSQFGRSFYKDYQDDLYVSERAGKWLEKRLIKLYEEEDIPVPFDYSYSLDQSLQDPAEKKDAYLNRSICSGGRWGYIIAPGGEVIPCDEMPVTDEYVVGNVSRQSIMEVWDSPGFHKYVKPAREPFKGTVCYECDIFDACHQRQGRCYRDALKAYGSMYEPAPACWKAPKGIRLT